MKKIFWFLITIFICISVNTSFSKNNTSPYKYQNDILKSLLQTSGDIVYFLDGLPVFANGVTVDKEGESVIGLYNLGQEKFEKCTSLKSRLASGGFGSVKPDIYASSDDKGSIDLVTARFWSDAKENHEKYIYLNEFHDGSVHELQKLKQNFKEFWSSVKFGKLIFGEKEYLTGDYLLFRHRTNDGNYLRSVLIKVIKSNCHNCKGISIIVRALQPNGLPISMRTPLKLFNRDVEAEFKQQKIFGDFYHALGLVNVQQHDYLWTIKKNRQSDIEKIKNRSQSEYGGFLEKGDSWKYERSYELKLYSLQMATRHGLKRVCEIRFN